ncbi:response regulator transcription factor, partial [Nocardia uniformis]
KPRAARKASWHMEIRVLVCDREPLIRLGLRSVLAGEPDLTVAGEFADASAAAAALASLRPDVIVADTEALSSATGCATGELVDAAMAQAIPVLVLAPEECAAGAVAALHAGARGFLLEHDPPSQIAYGIREVAAGNAILSPSVTGRLLSRLVNASPRRTGVDPRQVLTAREIQVLRLLATGLPVAAIAERLFVAEVTVRSHIHHMLRKLELDRAFQAVALAHESGLLDPESAAS